MRVSAINVSPPRTLGRRMQPMEVHGKVFLWQVISEHQYELPFSVGTLSVTSEKVWLQDLLLVAGCGSFKKHPTEASASEF